MYNANEETLESFSLQKARESVEVPIIFTQYALNEITGMVEGFMEFHEPVWSHHIQAQWEQLGAASVTILTFQYNDGNHSAASALNRVTKMASSPGFKMITTGCCNPRLMAKARELAEKDHAKLNTTTAEFDEKTQAVMKQSLAVAEKISECMVTKDQLQTFKESSQKSSEELKCRVVEINDKITQDYEDTIRNQSVTISKQAVTISKLESALEAKGRDMVAKQKDMDFLTKKNHSQSVIIAKLNMERDKDNKQTQAQHKLFEEMSRKLDELWKESKRRRRA
jgi:hypothetical protein